MDGDPEEDSHGSQRGSEEDDDQLGSKAHGSSLALKGGGAKRAVFEIPAFGIAALGTAEPLDEAGKGDGGIEEKAGGVAGIVGAEFGADPVGGIAGKPVEGEAGVVEHPAFGGVPGEMGGLLAGGAETDDGELLFPQVKADDKAFDLAAGDGTELIGGEGQLEGEDEAGAILEAAKGTALEEVKIGSGNAQDAIVLTDGKRSRGPSAKEGDGHEHGGKEDGAGAVRQKLAPVMIMGSTRPSRKGNAT
jgi:hypothetical protein